MPEEEAITPISEFNSAGLINSRVHYLWIDTNIHSRRGLFNQWNLDLDALWRELSGDLKKEKDFEDWDKRFQEFEKRLEKEGILYDGVESKGFQTPTKENLEKINRQYKILQEKHIFLKKLERFLGKGTKFKDLDEDMM